MANRYNTRNIQSLEKAPVVLYLRATVGATGAPTLVTLRSLGILSIARTGTGAYTIRFGGPAGNDTYQRLMSASFTFVGVSSAASEVMNVTVLADNSANASAPGVDILCTDDENAAVDPADGEIMLFSFTLSNTTAI